MEAARLRKGGVFLSAHCTFIENNRTFFAVAVEHAAGAKRIHMKNMLSLVLASLLVFPFRCFSQEPDFGGRNITGGIKVDAAFEIGSVGSVQGGVTLYLLYALEKAVQNYSGDWGLPKGELSDILAAISGQADGNVNPRHPGGYLHFDAGHFPDGKFKAIFFDAEGRLLDGWGRRFVMQRNQKTDAITIISCGPNGVLNQGSAEKANSDDIYVTIQQRR